VRCEGGGQLPGGGLGLQRRHLDLAGRLSPRYRVRWGLRLCILHAGLDRLPARGPQLVDLSLDVAAQCLGHVAHTGADTLDSLLEVDETVVNSLVAALALAVLRPHGAVAEPIVLFYTTNEACDGAGEVVHPAVEIALRPLDLLELLQDLIRVHLLP